MNARKILSFHYQQCHQFAMFNLKFLTVSFLVAIVSTQQQQPSGQPEVEILTEKYDVSLDGYNFVYKTSDGVSRQEEAHLITVGENQGIGVKGSYSYTAPDGQQYEVSFTADDKGYKPTIRVVGAQ
ncbi:unnamed protein product [Chilo suppressalis]|uniref:Uncharacterized protein n=1 Tax=Chilo suppressalis TaxID=168631 RepID=A0ABN8LDH2_CHISP|nr:unnamed protein product [Chilo suppressalis]